MIKKQATSPTSTYGQREQQGARSTKRKVKKPEWLFMLIFVLISGAIIYGTFRFVNQRIDTMEEKVVSVMSQEWNDSLNAIRLENEHTFETLKEQVVSLEGQMAALNDLLSNADASLGSSKSSSEALKERIEELDGQLASLEKSLKILAQRP